MINLQYLLSVIDFCMWFSKTIYQKPLHRHDKLTYVYDWRHEKKALKVKILHFKFLFQVALPTFSLSKKYEIFVFSMCITFSISIFVLYVLCTKINLRR